MSETATTEPQTAEVAEAPGRPPLDRRSRRRREIRERIVSAAEALFRQRGYRASTVAEICEQADVAYKTFFNHFPSKHEVLLEIEQRSLESLLAHFRAVLEQPGSTRARLVALFESIAREAAEAGPMNRELLADLIHSAHDRGDEPAQVRRVVEATEAIVAAGLEQGDLRTDVPVAALAETIRGHYYVLVISFGQLADYPIAERARAHAALAADAIEPKTPRAGRT